MSDKIFNYIKNTDKEPDFTGESAQYYIDKYVNRPEDAMTVEGLHNVLSKTGIINPFADMADFALYLLEGDKKGMAYSAAAIIPGMSYGKNIVNKALTQGSDYYSKFNKALNKLGNNESYINPTSIKVNFKDKVKKYKISHTNGYVPYKSTSGSVRPAVVVKIEGSSGNILYQPFYRSTGRGVPSMNSKGDWLPFEGVLPLNKSIKVNNQKIEGISQRSFQHELIQKKLNPNIKISSSGMPEGWVIKAFKSPDGNLYNTSIGGKTKRGLPLHEKISNYLNKIELEQ